MHTKSLFPMINNSGKNNSKICKCGVVMVLKYAPVYCSKLKYAVAYSSMGGKCGVGELREDRFSFPATLLDKFSLSCGRHWRFSPNRSNRNPEYINVQCKAQLTRLFRCCTVLLTSAFLSFGFSQMYIVRSRLELCTLEHATKCVQESIRITRIQHIYVVPGSSWFLVFRMNILYEYFSCPGCLVAQKLHSSKVRLLCVCAWLSIIPMQWV